MDDIKRVFNDSFEKAIIKALANETNLCLIPEKLDVKAISDYQPISLTSFLYKIGCS